LISSADLGAQLRRLRHSLAFNAALAILGVSGVVGVLVGGVGVDYLQQRESQRLDAQLTQLLDTVERTAQIAAFVADDSLATEVAEGLLRNEVVARVIIRSGPKVLADRQRAGEASQSESTPIIRQLVAPFEPNRAVGEIELVPASGTLQRKAAEFFSAVTVMLAVVVGTVVLVVLAAVLRLVAAPIKHVSDQLHALDIDDQARLKVPFRQDKTEIGVLVNDINTLIERIVAREKLYGAIVTQAADMILLIDAESAHFVEANPAAYAQLGYTRDELSALNADAVVPKLDARHRVGAHAEADQPAVFEARCKRKDGRSFDARISSGVIRMGDRTYLVWLVSDITEQKRTAEELRLNRDQLQQRVDEQTRDLIDARDHAEHLSQVKSEFLANMSHEIRTPLNAVLGMARIGVRDGAGQAHQDTFRHILDAGEHLLGVINDILDMSKIEAGKMALDASPFRLAAVIANASGFVVAQAAAKGISYTVDRSENLPDWVSGDAQRLQQILANLLSNAVKFTERGEVRLHAMAIDDEIHFTVADTGIGMTPEQAARLFAPFEQGDSSTSRRFGGTGLGLAISRRLAVLMGGEIRVESVPGAGSRFTLHLPLPRSQPGPSAGPIAVAPGGLRLKGLRVLAAEDIEVNRLILEDLLVQEGARVVFAENGLQAVEAVRNAGATAFDVVLMDVQMPEMDGYTATSQILKIAPDLPVIGLTAHAMAAERHRCLAAGMREHVAKPIDPGALISAVLVACGHVPCAPDDSGSVGADCVAPEATAGKTTVVDWIALLARFGGRRGTVDKLTASALRGVRERPAILRLAAQQSDLQAIQSHAHSLRGIAGNLLASGVQELATRCDASARGGQKDAFALAGALADAVEGLTAELEGRIADDMRIEASTPVVGEPPL
jgi:PAS domain S-box-containing protein